MRWGDGKGPRGLGFVDRQADGGQVVAIDAMSTPAGQRREDRRQKVRLYSIGQGGPGHLLAGSSNAFAR
ncbi:MAG: hypothetical protein ACYDC6_09415 [Acidobacteriaceae bacterium]